MSRKTIAFIIGAIIVIVAVIILVTQLKGSSPATTTDSSSPSTSASTTYTLTDVATHNNATSCWAAINGGVYDLTKWISQHPGGPDHILNLCGTDGSAAFNAQHGGQSQPAAALAMFKIGTLSQ